MKRYSIILALLIINCSNVYSQYSISYSQLEIVSYSVKISYVNNNFSPDYGYASNALQTLQARYDYYYNMMNNAWGKVRYCELINKYNNQKIRDKDREIENYLIANNHFRHVDLAQNGDFAIKMSKWMTDVFNDSNIKAEIKLLQSVHNEYYRLKRTYPDDFHKRDRYFELGKVLNLIVDCSPSQIGKIAMEYGLI
jgi:hypothetical protein